jgi:Flp pilus assembly protein TadD
MAEAAESLRRKGASRNATAHFKEALALDPLNVMALRGLGALLAAREDYSGAFGMLCRAREAGGDSAMVLHELGRVTAGMGRIATAVVYLERACELAPDDLAIRRTLADLGRKPRATVKLKERAAQIPAQPRRRPQI